MTVRPVLPRGNTLRNLIAKTEERRVCAEPEGARPADELAGEAHWRSNHGWGSRGAAWWRRARVERTQQGWEAMSLNMADLSWSLAVGGGFAFFTSFGIGANDVANAFASSVGSGAVSYQKAVVIAAIFEFCGAVFLGSHVTGTIRKGIADLDQFCDTPDQVCAPPAHFNAFLKLVSRRWS